MLMMFIDVMVCSSFKYEKLIFYSFVVSFVISIFNVFYATDENSDDSICGKLFSEDAVSCHELNKIKCFWIQF